MAAIYFGGFSFTPQDAALSRQALYKLSFLHRHYLQPAGLRVAVLRQTATLSGHVKSKLIAVMASILAQQIDGIALVKDETESPKAPHNDLEIAREALQLMFATDQTLRCGLRVSVAEKQLILEGETTSPAQKAWAEQLTSILAGRVDSRVRTTSGTAAAPASPVDMDDESLQALALMRLRLARETEHLPLRVKASRGVITLQGKVRTEALRQRAENLVRSTLGLRELRSSIAIAA